MHFFLGGDPLQKLRRWIEGMRRKSWGAQILHRPIVVWRRASAQRPTITINTDYDVNNPAAPVYLELDETTRGSEHYSALLLGDQDNDHRANACSSSKRPAKVNDLGASPVTSRSRKRDASASPVQTPDKKERVFSKRPQIRPGVVMVKERTRHHLYSLPVRKEDAYYRLRADI